MTCTRLYAKTLLAVTLATARALEVMAVGAVALTGAVEHRCGVPHAACPLASFRAVLSGFALLFVLLFVPLRRRL